MDADTYGSDVGVRPFAARDHEAVVELWRSVFPDDPPWNDAAELIRRKLTVQPDLLLVACRERDVVGAVMAGFDGVRGWIHHLAVRPDSRHLGIGSRLLAAAEAGLRALGCPKVNLQVRATNPVIAFYETNGYRLEERASMGKRLGASPGTEARPSSGVELHRRPAPGVVEEIVCLARSLSPAWFTPNVPEDTRRDLAFHDALCLRAGGELAGVVVFTSLDGSIHITLMAVRPELHGRGLGSELLAHLFRHASSLGYDRVVVLTVPPDVKPVYESTLRFYEKRGFVVSRRLRELWEHDALELVRPLADEPRGSGA
jgi:ribosomal protein S18 acetylase RimI-like enzyme